MANSNHTSSGGKSHHRLTAGAPSLIEFKGRKFLIINNPTQSTVPNFIAELQRHSAKVVVRCCEPSYNAHSLEDEGIKVVDLQFEDGGAPSESIISSWLELVKDTFESDPDCAVAVHCVAGLGRAPVLVAVALIENGMKYYEAVDYIRSKRRGAINQRQLNYLEHYKTKKSCRIM